MLFFITSNQSKFNEAREVIGDLSQLDIDLPEIQEMDPWKIIEAKLKEAFSHSKGEFIIEDTSLYIKGMKGLPGPLVKWFLKAVGNSGLYKMTSSFNNFEAEAKTIIGYAKSPFEIKFFEGTAKGKIVKEKGKNGFGWDSIFIPDGYNKTYAEMSFEEKNKIS